MVTFSFSTTPPKSLTASDKKTSLVLALTEAEGRCDFSVFDSAVATRLQDYLLKNIDFDPKMGTIHASSKLKNFPFLAFLGLKEKGETCMHTFAQAGGKLGAALEKQETKEVFLCLPDMPKEKAGQVLLGLALRSWRFDTYQSKKKACLDHVTVITPNADALKTYVDATIYPLIEGVLWGRQLVNLPANDLTPSAFLKEIQACTALGAKVTVLDQKNMETQGMGALLGVAQGSEEPPYLVSLHWRGASDPKADPIALVGKGVTFDTGGISLKPAGGMEEMKGDMGGAAVVVGTLKALALMKAPVNAVAVVALVENMPSGKAQRPGDIVTSLSGQTIEVLNTDAEGRLILADALTYTEDTFGPKAIVDVATLTGAMRHALGPIFAGVFSDNTAVQESLCASGELTGERLWPMPLDPAFLEAMKGSVSDLQNISPPGFGAGSSTAAQFLKCFVKKTPWAHLDIASVDYLRKDTPLATKGGSAFGIRLLCDWALKAWKQSF